MTAFQSLAYFLGRLFLSSIFIISSFSDIIDWNSTEQFILNSFTNTVNAGPTGSLMVNLVEMLLPWVSVLFVIAIVLKLLGGILVLIGWKVRFGAFLLMLFIIPVTFLIHTFWNMQEPERTNQMIMFMKNISILGGLFLLVAFGKGCGKKNSSHHKEA